MLRVLLNCPGYRNGAWAPGDASVPFRPTAWEDLWGAISQSVASLVAEE